MGTRSAIAVKHGNIIKAVYCHWDGYLEWNGRMLHDYYDSPKANNLVALGNISSLREEIGEKHPFSFQESKLSIAEHNQLYGNMTTFYYRDRGEHKAYCEYKVFDNYQAFHDHYYNAGCEYFYLMEDGNWFYSTYNNTQLRTLADEFALSNGTE
jgi:hypothetical protein